MAGRVAGKVALVTGAGSSGPGWGTGKAISVTLAREGASVALVDVAPERAQETLQQVEEVGGKGAVVGADISDPGDCERMVEAAAEEFGGLDILVNNAAITKHLPITETTIETYEQIIGVNQRGAFFACKFAIPHMIARGGGSIVNISSIAGVRDSGSPHPAYASSKAALLGMTTDLAGAYGAQNIRVNAILPGMIDSPMLYNVMGVLPERGALAQSDKMLANFLGRRGDAWDIANAVLFLTSNEGSYVTGVALPVDGGATAGMAASYIVRYGS